MMQTSLNGSFSNSHQTAAFKNDVARTSLQLAATLRDELRATVEFLNESKQEIHALKKEINFLKEQSEEYLEHATVAHQRADDMEKRYKQQVVEKNEMEKVVNRLFRAVFAPGDLPDIQYDLSDQIDVVIKFYNRCKQEKEKFKLLLLQEQKQSKEKLDLLSHEKETEIESFYKKLETMNMKFMNQVSTSNQNERSLREEIKGFRHKEADAASRISELESEIQALQNASQENKKYLRHYEHQTSKLESDMKVVLGKNNELEDANADLTSQLAFSKASFEETVEKLTAQIAANDKADQTKTFTIETLNQKVSQLSSEKASLQQNYEKLQKNLHEYSYHQSLLKEVDRSIKELREGSNTIVIPSTALSIKTKHKSSHKSKKKSNIPKLVEAKRIRM